MVIAIIVLSILVGILGYLFMLTSEELKKQKIIVKLIYDLHQHYSSDLDLQEIK
jgi:hypothetical protein